MSKQWYLVRLLFVSVFLTSLVPGAVYGQAATPDTTSGPAAPEWMEPRGLNVVDLVGLVPESHLVDTILSSRVGLGIVQYVSGSRSGDTVTINVRFHPRYWTDGTSWATLFGCLGKPAIDDEWPVAVPPATMRVYENGNEITSEIAANFDHVPAGQNHPDSGATGWWRYNYLWGQRTTFNEDGSVGVPANMGCGYSIPRRITDLTATFVFTSPNYLVVEEVGSESFIFHSYIGVGNSGHLGNLNQQMNRRFGNRHDKFDLAIPSTTDYALVKFPPTPVDPYMGQPEINVFLNGSGTYRLNGSDNTLSVDHVNSMAIPIFGQWQDADQSGGDFLRFFDNTLRLASPEYFVPTQIAYDGCMTNGGCSDELLDQIYNAEMTITIYYYRIARIRTGLDRIPLQQVGPDWSSLMSRAGVDQGSVLAADAGEVLTETMITERLATAPASDFSAPDAPTTTAQKASKYTSDGLIYLPLIYSTEPPPEELPDGDASDCPCGWFDSYGRMFDFVPGP